MLKNDGERMKKNRVYVVLGSGTAVPPGARAVPTYWLFGWFGKARDGTAVPLQAWAVPSFWHMGLKFFFSFHFLESVSDNYLQNNL